jgi:hypothetical protein
MFAITIFGGIISLSQPKWYKNLQQKIQDKFPDWKGKMKHLSWIAPLTLFVLITIITTSILMPINIWNHEQRQLSILNTNINDLQKQLSSITSLTFTELPMKDVHINSPSQAEVNVTYIPDFNPSYLGTKPCIITNTDLFNHVKELVKITINPSNKGLKFTDISTLPSNILIVNKYGGTDELILMIKDILPGGSVTIDLPIYSYEINSDISSEIHLKEVVIDRGTVP